MYHNSNNMTNLYVCSYHLMSRWRNDLHAGSINLKSAKGWEVSFCVSVWKQRKQWHAGQLTSDPLHPQGHVHLTRLLFAKWAKECATFQQKDNITSKALCLDYTLLAMVPKCFLLPLQLSRSTRTATHSQQRNKFVSLWQLALHLECEGLADRIAAFITHTKLPRDNMASILSDTVPFQMFPSVHHQQMATSSLFLFLHYNWFPLNVGVDGWTFCRRTALQKAQQRWRSCKGLPCYSAKSGVCAAVAETTARRRQYQHDINTNYSVKRVVTKT